MVLGGDVDRLEVGGAGAEVSGGEGVTVLVNSEASPCITWATAESGFVSGMRKLSMAA